MKVIGMIGGVGCGKSTVCNLIDEKYNAKLILTDDLAKELMNKGKEAYLNVVREFGDDILDENKDIDRKKLADIVFNDSNKLEILNKCTHPIVIAKVKEMIARYRELFSCNDSEKKDVLVIESALLFESGLDSMCDEIWLVITDDEVRRARLKSSRGYSDEKIDAMFKSQTDYEKYRAVVNKVIVNNGNQDELIKQIII